MTVITSGWGAHTFVWTIGSRWALTTLAHILTLDSVSVCTLWTWDHHLTSCWAVVSNLTLSHIISLVGITSDDRCVEAWWGLDGLMKISTSKCLLHGARWNVKWRNCTLWTVLVLWTGVLASNSSIKLVRIGIDTSFCWRAANSSDGDRVWLVTVGSLWTLLLLKLLIGSALVWTEVTNWANSALGGSLA